MNRYSRQIILSDLGSEGQRKLQESSVLVIGAGGLGCPVLSYLTASGIGKIGIMDGDRVELSNLHRQVLYTDDDTGQLKAEMAKSKLSAQNPEVSIHAYNHRIDSSNALEIIGQYDIVVDGSDNFPTRYLVNDACVLVGRPLVYGAVHQFEGQVCVLNYKDENGNLGPNYRDLFPKPPLPGQVPNCSDAGILGVLPGIIGLFQANEVFKIILGWDDILSGRLLLFDSRSSETRIVKFTGNKDNPLLSQEFQLIDYQSFCGLECGRGLSISEEDFSQLLLSDSSPMIIDVREPSEVLDMPFMGKNIPLANIENRRDQIPTDVPVVIICRSGQRSMKAIRVLRSLGKYDNIYSLDGGIEHLDKKKY